MIKVGRLVKEQGLNNNYYEVLSINRDTLELMSNGEIDYCDIDNYEEVTNENIEWDKVPKGTTIYYFSDVDYKWVESEFIDYRADTKESYSDGADFLIRRDKGSDDDLVLMCRDAKIMDDWLEEEMKIYTTEETEDAGTEALKQCLKYVENMSVEDYEKLYRALSEKRNPYPDDVIDTNSEDDMLSEIVNTKPTKCKTKGCNNLVVDKEDGRCRSCYVMEMNSTLFNKEVLNWRLPNKEELNLLYVNLHKNNIGNFNNESYWSSEWCSNYAWGQYFYSGGQFSSNKIYERQVRPVRNFKSEIIYKIGDETETGFIFWNENYEYKECAKENLPNKLNWFEAMDCFKKSEAKVFSDKKMEDFLENKFKKHLEDKKLKDAKKYNEKDILKDAYNYIEKFLEYNEADNQYFNQLDILYKIAKNGLKTIDKI